MYMGIESFNTSPSPKETIEDLEAQIKEIEETLHPEISNPEAVSKLRELKQRLVQMKVDRGLA